MGLFAYGPPHKGQAHEKPTPSRPWHRRLMRLPRHLAILAMLDAAIAIFELAQWVAALCTLTFTTIAAAVLAFRALGDG